MKNLSYQNIAIIEEAERCLLCDGGPCTTACPYGVKPDRIIRTLRFDNVTGAADRSPADIVCFTCRDKACMKACTKGKIARPIAIDEILTTLSAYEKSGISRLSNVDLSVTFCSVKCENPFFLSSSSVCSHYDMVARAFDIGWAGVAFKTIGTFVPREVSPRFDVQRQGVGAFHGFKNIEQISEHTLEENLGYLKKLKENYPTKVIMASIMGQDEEEWRYLAQMVTEAGADIIECNFSCPHMAADGLGSDVGQNPELVSRYVKAVKRGSHLPLLAKMTPNIGNMEIPALAAIKAGADGLAAINTIKSIINIDLDSFSSGPDVEGKTSVGGFSGRAVKPIALQFIHAMKSCQELADAPISGMGGIDTWRDAAEFIALGCGTVQVTTSVMQYGYRIIEDMLEGLRYYMNSHGFKSVSDFCGSALPNIIQSDDLNRDSICFPKFDRHKCIACGRCYLSCLDGGHQAIGRDGQSGKPILKAKSCVGCHLCAMVCPVGAISPGKRVSKDKLRKEADLNGISIAYPLAELAEMYEKHAKG